MATKQATNQKSSNTGAGAAPARAAKAGAARVTTVKHSKPAVVEAAVEVPAVQKVVAAPVESRHEAIAALAYGYWEARGFQGGEPASDWFRAEAEYRQQTR